MKRIVGRICVLTSALCRESGVVCLTRSLIAALLLIGEPKHVTEIHFHTLSRLWNDRAYNQCLKAFNLLYTEGQQQNYWHPYRHCLYSYPKVNNK